jgi:glyceraldehyde 3-phosphate dehydrogenase
MSSDDAHTAWIDRQTQARHIAATVGELFNRQGIEIKVFGKSLINETPLSILKILKRGCLITGENPPIADYTSLLDAVDGMGLGLCKIDIGKLVSGYAADRGRFPSPKQYVRAELSDDFFNTEAGPKRPKDVVLYGFGRIGRILTRLLIETTGAGRFFRLRGVVVRGKGGAEDLFKRADLLRHDSIHGAFDGIVDEDPENAELIVNGARIKFIFADHPNEIDYADYGFENVVVVDNTGTWRDREGLSQHVRGVSRKVILTAPGKGDIPNIVFGVNHEGNCRDAILSCASCTTNAVVPVLKAIHDEFGVASGHIETIHSYTNDQNLLDNYHSADRRGRAAPMNMVITTTGAAKAVAKVLPEYAGKLTGNSVRVPTPNVSLAILNLTFPEPVDRERLNDFLRRTALHSKLQKQIDYTVFPVVSSDLGKSVYTGVVDSMATLVRENHAVIYVWYDNEFGYSHQVKRLVKYICGDDVPEYNGRG